MPVVCRWVGALLNRGGVDPALGWGGGGGESDLTSLLAEIAASIASLHLRLRETEKQLQELTTLGLQVEFVESEQMVLQLQIDSVGSKVKRLQAHVEAGKEGEAESQQGADGDDT